MRPREEISIDLQLKSAPHGVTFKTLSIWETNYKQLLALKSQLEKREIRTVSMAEIIDALLRPMNLGRL